MMIIPDDSSQLDTIFGALSNHKRRVIVHDLALQPATIGQLAHRHNLSLPAIHRHVRTLEEARLIIRKKAGRTNFIALDQSTLKQTQQWIMQYQTNWSNTNATLENYISRMQE